MSDLNILLDIEENIDIFCDHEVEYLKNNNETLRTLFEYKEFKKKHDKVKNWTKEKKLKFPDPQFVETGNDLKKIFDEEEMKKNREK